MKCLHICNDLVGSKVHDNLYKNLKKLNLDQIVFYPLRKHAITKVDDYKEGLNYRLVTSTVLNNSHRVLFKKKVNTLYKSLKNQVDLESCELVHATTLFSDGAIALKIWKEFQIPYIVAIRGTDINFYLKYRYDLHSLGKEIITNAKQLIFISNTLENNFISNNYIKSLKKHIIPSNTVIHNGLDPFWIQNRKPKKKNNTPLKFLYIGKFDSNKNVLRVIKSFLQLRKKYGTIELNLVGKGGSQEKSIRKLAKKNKGIITFHGAIYNKKELQNIYQNNDIFVMVSKSETFGLVYVEALTQGLPLLFTKNQGIDGTFNEYIGESVNQKSIISIVEGMQRLMNNYDRYEIDEIDFAKFSWEGIAKTYIDLYHKVLN